jgi:hypothetical protein
VIAWACDGGPFVLRLHPGQERAVENPFLREVSLHGEEVAGNNANEIVCRIECVTVSVEMSKPGDQVWGHEPGAIRVLSQSD